MLLGDVDLDLSVDVWFRLQGYNAELDPAILLGKLERMVEGPQGMVGVVNGDEKLVHVGALSWSATNHRSDWRCSVFLTRSK
jgi:hypothetical protein